VQRTKAFTLIELLVVVAIIALLVGILVPSLNKARGQAKRAACAAHLRQVGVALVAYMQDSGDRMPYVSFMPSVGPAPLTTDEPIHLADALKRQISSQEKVLRCPEDRPRATERPAPNTGLSYFESERSSYEYRVRLAGLTPEEFHQVVKPPWQPASDQTTPASTIWVARDYENFHGKAGQDGARRYLYIDGHVSDFEN